MKFHKKIQRERILAVEDIESSICIKLDRPAI